MHGFSRWAGYLGIRYEARMPSRFRTCLAGETGCWNGNFIYFLNRCFGVNINIV